MGPSKICLYKFPDEYLIRLVKNQLPLPHQELFEMSCYVQWSHNNEVVFLSPHPLRIEQVYLPLGIFQDLLRLK